MLNLRLWWHLPATWLFPTHRVRSITHVAYGPVAISHATQVAIRAVPHRHDFYARLAQGGSHEKFDSELAKWLAGLEVVILRMKDFLEQGGYGTV